MSIFKEFLFDVFTLTSTPVGRVRLIVVQGLPKLITSEEVEWVITRKNIPYTVERNQTYEQIYDIKSSRSDTEKGYIIKFMETFNGG